MSDFFEDVLGRLADAANFNIIDGNEFSWNSLYSDGDGDVTALEFVRVDDSLLGSWLFLVACGRSFF